MKSILFTLALLVGCTSSTHAIGQIRPLVLAPPHPFSSELAIIDEMIEYVKKDIERSDRLAKKKRPPKIERHLAKN